MTPEHQKHLRWIYNRMIELHGENPNVDYMLKFDEIIGKEPTIIPNSNIDSLASVIKTQKDADNFMRELNNVTKPKSWIEVTGEEYKAVLETIKDKKPYKTNSSFHIYEELYMINGVKHRVLSAMADDPKDPNYQPLITKEE